MKRGLLAVVFMVMLLDAFAQAGFSTHRYRFGGKQRKYISYVPNTYYDSGVKVPLLFALHGFGDNIDNFSNIGFHRIADTANFIVVYPEALPDPILFANAWNSGAGLGGQIPFNSTVDDVGFLNSLMDTMMMKYNIDTSRVYFTGFSFGGFMTSRMGCEASSRVAAIASVSGTIGSTLNCQPEEDMPVVHFHGTSDNTINFQNNPYGKSAIPNVKYWAQINECDPDPDTLEVPDVMNDGLTLVHYVYKNCVQGDEVEFYRVNNGEHQWLSSTVNDISYNQTIWAFLRKWRRGGVPLAIRPNQVLEGEVTIYPNPGDKGLIYLDISHLEAVKLEAVEVIDYLGRSVSKQVVQNAGTTIQVDAPAMPGPYLVKLTTADGRSKVVKWVRL